MSGRRSVTALAGHARNHVLQIRPGANACRMTAETFGNRFRRLANAERGVQCHCWIARMPKCTSRLARRCVIRDTMLEVEAVAKSHRSDRLRAGSKRPSQQSRLLFALTPDRHCEPSISRCVRIRKAGSFVNGSIAQKLR